MASQPPPGPTLIKGLASCNTTLRSKSLRLLLSWLPSQPQLPEDELMKLWKALFYCVWHCDKLQNQTRLVNRLASLLPTLPPPLSLLYFSHFLITLRREWPGIDRLRLDKFYMLIRVFVRNLFVLLKKRKWGLDVLEDFVGVLEKRVFFVDENDGSLCLGNGVSYHIVSVFCEELKPFLPVRFDVLNVLFRPFVDTLGKSSNKVLVGKIKSEVFGYLGRNGKGLLEIRRSGGEVDLKDEVVLFGTIALVMGFSRRFYELGSSVDCVQGNRKVLFALHEEFLKLEKERESLGVEVSVPEVSEDQDDEEVPQLIAISSEAGVTGSLSGSESRDGVVKMDEDAEGKPSKGSKKEKKSKHQKGKKNKKKKSSPVDLEGEGAADNSNSVSMDISNGDITVSEAENDGENSIVFSETVISNLQKQFERIAAESGMDEDGESALESRAVRNGKASKKRKREKNASKKNSVNSDTNYEEHAQDNDTPRTVDKSAKKVRFSLKNNLVWKPHSPLPPQSLRLPPSATPRGSALKKGLSPGPIRVMSQVKKAKKKKVKKAGKSLSQAVKRVKKPKSIST